MSKTYRTIHPLLGPGSNYYKWVNEVDERGLNHRGKDPRRNKYTNGRDGVVGRGVTVGHNEAPRKGWHEVGGSSTAFFKRYASKRDRKLGVKHINEVLKEDL